jgi:ABC-type multidrug transport system fused ATPase/permease subunit
MKTRKLISFLVALICVGAMIWMEISITPLTGWKLAPVALLIAAIGIGRMYLFYEGTALREVGTKPARIAFRMSIGISIAFAVYVSVLTALGKADWYEFSLFQLGNIVLLCVEWIFSFRQGAESDTLLSRLRNRGDAMLKQAEKLRGKLRTAIAENSDLKTEVERLKTEEKRLSTLVDSVSAENSENQELLSTLRKRVSELEKVAELSQSLPAEKSDSENAQTEIHAGSDVISDETLTELLSEFPNSEDVIQKISERGSRKSLLNRRTYLRSLQRKGTLNGEATELQILEKLL